MLSVSEIKYSVIIFYPKLLFINFIKLRFMHPIKNEGDLHQNTSSKTLNLKMIQMFRGSGGGTIDLLDKELPASNYYFEPGEIVYDETGLVRFFSYVNTQDIRLEFVAQEPQKSSNIEATKTAVKDTVKFVANVMYYASIIGKADELYGKFKTNKLTAEQVVADGAIWFVLKELRGYVTGKAMHSATNFAHKELIKYFPKLTKRNDIVYFETKTGMFKVKGGIYI